MVLTARQVGVPLVIISGRRTPAENRAAGGADNSYHLRGLAFDVGVYGYTRDQIPPAWWAMLGTWAEANLGLTWGGRFTTKVSGGERVAMPPDVNHFDLRVIET